MNILIRFSFILLSGILLFTGCARSPHALQTSAPNPEPQGMRLSTAKVIRIAKQSARREGVDLGEFNDPRLRYGPDRKGEKFWVVIFEGRVPMPGHHFMVIVNDHTAEAAFSPGM